MNAFKNPSNLDLATPRLWPLALQEHIVFDLETGATFKSQEHDPHNAILSVLIDALEEEDFKKLDVEMKFTVYKEARGRVFGSQNMAAFQSKENPQILQVGSLVLWNECLHDKNFELLMQRYERLAGPSENLPEDLDVTLAKRFRKDIDGQYSDHHDPERRESRGKPSDVISDLLSEVFGGRVMPLDEFLRGKS